MYPQKLQDAILTTRDGNGDELECKVRVVDVTDTAILITVPVDKNGYAMFLPPASRVNLGYVSQGYVHFDTVVVQHVRDRVSMMAIEKPPLQELNRDQRRQSFRVPVTLKTTVVVKDENVLLNLLDLSAGGFLATSTNQKLALEDAIEGKLMLKSERGDITVPYTGQVTRVGLDAETQEVIYGVEFDEMGMRSDTIMRYCMERQRRYLRTLNEDELS